VPLYSPNYLANSWSLREQEAFQRRLSDASAVTPNRHIVSILWTPIPVWDQNERLIAMGRVGSNNADYRENGMRALCMLASYRRSYEDVLAALAKEIVTVAENLPLGPSAPPDLVDEPGEASAEAGFLVAILEPPSDNGGSRWWRPYAGRRIQPVAEYVRNVANRLGLSAEVGEFSEFEKLFQGRPGVLLVDPEAVADRGQEFVASTLAKLPEWIIPVILDDSAEARDPAGDVLANELVGPTGSDLSRVGSMDELDEILPAVIARARRRYLRKGQAFPPPGSPKRRRLRREGDQ
jgi:FxsC-like protein